MGGVKRTSRLAATLVMICAAAVVTTAQPASQTASEFYMSYRTAFAKAKAIEEVLPYMSTAVRAKIEATPADERTKMFEFVKSMSNMSDVKVLKETKTADGVTLSVEGISEKQKVTGQIQIVKEDGAWKMGRESWSSKG